MTDVYFDPNSTRYTEKVTLTIEAEVDEAPFLHVAIDDEGAAGLMNAHGEIDLMLTDPADVDAFEKAVTEACEQFRRYVANPDA